MQLILCHVDSEQVWVDVRQDHVCQEVEWEGLLWIEDIPHIRRGDEEGNQKKL